MNNQYLDILNQKCKSAKIWLAQTFNFFCMFCCFGDYWYYCN